MRRSSMRRKFQGRARAQSPPPSRWDRAPPGSLRLTTTKSGCLTRLPGCVLGLVCAAAAAAICTFPCKRRVAGQAGGPSKGLGGGGPGRHAMWAAAFERNEAQEGFWLSLSLAQVIAPTGHYLGSRPR
jgi:hypothetical protein